jgi:tetratricopeptide (TPR) repeat protein
MFRLNLTPPEKKIIRNILIISGIICLLIVSGTWVFYKIQMGSSIAKTKIKSDPVYSTAIQPFDISAHRALASRYMHSGAPEKAIAHLERIHALDKRDNTITLELAHASLEAGNYRQALEYYDFLIDKKGPDSSGAAECACRGIALFYLDKVEESAEALLDCIKRFPDNAEAYCFLGQIEASKSLISEKAVEYFNRSIAVDSTYIEARYQLARYYMQSKIFTKARELLLSSVAINPFHSKSYSRLGMVYYYLDYPVLAKKSYQTALLLNPDDFNTCYNLAELLLSSFNDTISALKEYKKALELNSRFYEAAFRIGLICLKNNMNKEAIKYFEQALSVVPHDIRILLQCAIAWEKIDRKDKAAEMYTTILSIDELNDIARQKLKLLAGN